MLCVVHIKTIIPMETLQSLHDILMLASVIVCGKAAFKAKITMIVNKLACEQALNNRKARLDFVLQGFKWFNLS